MSPAVLSVQTAALGQVGMISLAGELDQADSGRVARTIDVMAQNVAGLVVVDLTEVDFIDLSGVRILTDAYARLTGRLRILPASAVQVRRILESTGATATLAVCTIKRLPQWYADLRPGPAWQRPVPRAEPRRSPWSV